MLTVNDAMNFLLFPTRDILRKIVIFMYSFINSLCMHIQVYVFQNIWRFLIHFLDTLDCCFLETLNDGIFLQTEKKMERFYRYLEKN